MKKNYSPIKALIILLCIFSVNLSAQLSGTVTINSGNSTGGTNYQTFNALASALNTNGISGPLTVNVVSATGPYNEQVSFNQIAGLSATNTITINGNGNLLTFNGTSGAPHTLLLNGTDYLYINNLQMEGTNSTYAMVCILMNTADFNTFSSCTFSAPANGTSSYQIPWSISSSATSPSSGGIGNSNTVKSSTLSGGYYSVFLYSSTAPTMVDNSFIECNITDWYVYCIWAYYSKNLTFRNCDFNRMTRTSFTTTYLCYAWGSQGMMFDGNTIHDLFNTNQTNTNTFYGFYYLGYDMQDPSNRNTIRNNIFRDIKFGGSSYYFIYGYYYANNDYIHNTFSLDNTTSTSGTHYVFYYGYGSGSNYNTWKNNLFSVTMAGSGTKYCMYFGGTVTNAIVDNNDYYITSTNAYIGYWTGIATTLSQWQAMGPDVNGYNLNPNCANLAGGDLHPTKTSLNKLFKTL
jgi:hypothetical protein